MYRSGKIWNSSDNLLAYDIIEDNYMHYRTYEKENQYHKEKRMPPPQDKYKLVCMGFAILGITTLLPWNFFITATDYWMYKFRNVSSPANLIISSQQHQPNDDSHFNSTQDQQEEQQRTPLQTFFESYLAIAANFPMTIAMTLNSIYGQRFSQKKRLYASLTMMLLIFALTTIFVKINTDNYQNLFFAITMIMVVVVSFSSAVFQAAIFGVVASFPNNCMLTMVNGQAIAGLLAVLVQILTMISDAGPIESGLWYFFTSTIFIGFAIICYWCMNNEYTRYYLVRIPNESSDNASSQENGEQSNDNNDRSSTMNLLDSRNELKEVLRECWQLALSVVLAFWISLSVFPAVCVLIVPQYPNTSIFTGRFYTPITTFILFNFADLCGRICSAYVPFPTEKKNALLGLSSARIIFPFLILFCNVQPRSYTNVWFKSDLYFPIFNTLSALTNGYLFSSAMVMASSNASRDKLELTGFVMATALGVGLTLGSITSTVFLRII